MCLFGVFCEDVWNEIRVKKVFEIVLKSVHMTVALAIVSAFLL